MCMWRRLKRLGRLLLVDGQNVIICNGIIVAVVVVLKWLHRFALYIGCADCGAIGILLLLLVAFVLLFLFVGVAVALLLEKGGRPVVHRLDVGIGVGDSLIDWLCSCDKS